MCATKIEDVAACCIQPMASKIIQSGCLLLDPTRQSPVVHLLSHNLSVRPLRSPISTYPFWKHCLTGWVQSQHPYTEYQQQTHEPEQSRYIYSWIRLQSQVKYISQFLHLLVFLISSCATTIIMASTSAIEFFLQSKSLWVVSFLLILGVYHATQKQKLPKGAKRLPRLPGKRVSPLYLW